MIRCFFLSFLFLIASCQHAPLPSRQVPRLSLSSDPTTLDPRKARDLDSINLIRMLFEGLTRMGKAGETELALADRVDISEDGLRYTFHLRKSQWSNGDSLTASDFAASWKAILHPNFATDIAYQLYPIKNARRAKLGEIAIDAVGVSAQDDQTLIVDLESPLPYFLDLVSTPPFLPVHAKIAEQNPNWPLDPVSFAANGPFLLKSWKHSDRICLEKNPHFWEKKRVRLDGVDFFVASPDTALRMYEEDALDWTGSPLSLIPPDAVAALRQESRLQISPFLATYFYRVNTAPRIGGRKNPLSDPNMRRALSFALDREAIVSHILQGGQAAARSLVPPSMGLKTDGYFFDQKEEARLSLAKCEPLEEPLVISYLNNERNAAVAQAVQKQWETTLKIRTQLEAVEPKVFYARISNKEFQVAGGSWSADFNDPVNFLEVFKYKDGSTNNTAWEKSDYIDLLNRSGLCKEKSERKELLRQAEAILMEEMPIIPVYHVALNYLKRPQLEGAVLSPMGQLDLRWAYFEPAQETENKAR